MGRSLDTAIAYGVFWPGYENEDDMMYAVEGDEETLEDFIERRVLGEDRIRFGQGIEWVEDGPYEARRVANDRAFAEWKKSDLGKQYEKEQAELKEFMNGLDIDHSGVADYTTPIVVVKSTRQTSYYEPTLLNDLGAVEYEHKINLIADMVGLDYKKGWILYGSYY